jgi:hypothetical protein
MSEDRLELHNCNAKRTNNTKAAPTKPFFSTDGWRHCYLTVKPEAWKRAECQTGSLDLELKRDYCHSVPLVVLGVQMTSLSVGLLDDGISSQSLDSTWHRET